VADAEECKYQRTSGFPPKKQVMSFEFQGKTCLRSQGYMNGEAADGLVCELWIQWAE